MDGESKESTWRNDEQPSDQVGCDMIDDLLLASRTVRKPKIKAVAYRG